MKPREIEVHIENLVLHGLPQGSRHNISESIQRELSRLLADRGVPDTWRSSPAEIAAQIHSTPPPIKTAATGEQIARAVYGEGTR